jgi:hypothetical protein
LQAKLTRAPLVGGEKMGASAGVEPDVRLPELPSTLQSTTLSCGPGQADI